MTALALSHDHTFIAAGHEYGHIQLFDLSKPNIPARTVVPVTIAAVSSGRQEGHLVGSCIVHVAFIGGRNTAITSADDQGLAFYHSLGKMLFIEASDILRILGKYPDEDVKMTGQLIEPKIGTNEPPRHPPSVLRNATKVQTRRQKRTASILAVAPLPLGTFSHSTDAYHLIAMLTPLKLVVVGLNPSPKTWFRIHREGEDDVQPESNMKGHLAWFPSVALSDRNSGLSVAVDLDKNSYDHKSKRLNVTPPLLAYSWGPSLFVLSIFETRVYQKVRIEKSGKIEKVAVGKLNFRSKEKLTLEYDILNIQWLNINVSFNI